MPISVMNVRTEEKHIIMAVQETQLNTKICIEYTQIRIRTNALHMYLGECLRIS